MAKEINVIKRGQSTFQLIGKAVLGNYTFDLERKSKNSDWVSNRMNLTVETKEGRISAEMYGGYYPTKTNTIYVHGKDENEKDDFKNMFQVDFEDRFDEEVLEQVGDMCFTKVALEVGEDGKLIYKNFLHQMDAIEYIKDNLKDGDVINVKGELKYKFYNGEMQIKKNITSVYLVIKEEVVNDVDSHVSKFTQTILTDSNFLGRPDKETMTVPVDAYIVDFFDENQNKQEIVRMVNGKQKKGLTMPVSMSFDFKIAKDMETTKKLLKYLKPKRGAVTEIVMEGIFSKSQGELKGEELTIDDLDDDIKFMVEIGAYTLEEALGKVNFVYGEMKPEKMLLTRPAIKKIEGKDGSSTLAVNYTPDKYNEEDLIIENILEVNNAKFKVNEEEEEEDIFNEEETEDNDDLDLDDDWSDIF